MIDPDYGETWYHGSPSKLTSIRKGSTITQDRRLAEVFSHKPLVVSISDDGTIRHNGTMPGYLYIIAERIQPSDVAPHPRSCLQEGKEWLINRDLQVVLVDTVVFSENELLTKAEVEELFGMIGLKRGTVKLVPHNPEWAVLFEEEKYMLTSAFGNTIIAIEHVGSTAIPGIPAKPIIDINIGVKTLEIARGMKDRFADLGYEYRPFVPGHTFEDLKEQELYVKGPESKRTHHVHVAVCGSDFWKRSLLFRDYLRQHSDRAHEYADLKEGLAQEYQNDRGTYSKNKSPFIIQTLEMAKAWADSIIYPCKIGFRRLTMDDLPLIHHWRNMQHVRAFYGNPQGCSYEEVVEKYEPRIRGEQPTSCYIITLGDNPVGLIQTYLWRDYPKYAKFLDLQEEAASLDVFIGEEKYLHRGLGCSILRRFLQTIVFSDECIQSCVITPEERNTSAIRAYEKAGFKYIRIIDHPGEPGPVRIMRIAREEAFGGL